MTFWMIVLLMFIGIFLIVLEAVVTFGISAVAGVLLIAYSIYVVFAHYSVALSMIYTIAAVALAGSMCWWVMRSSTNWLGLSAPQAKKNKTNDTPAAPQPKVGDSAQVLQPLHPTGTVLWEGQRLSARSIDPAQEIAAGQTVTITGLDSIYVLVEAAQSDKA